MEKVISWHELEEALMKSEIIPPSASIKNLTLMSSKRIGITVENK